MSRQAVIDAIEQKVAAAGTVVGSAVALLTGFIQAVRDSADDEDELAAVLAQIESQINALSAAVAAGTAAQSEQPVDDTTDQPGGEDTVTGSDGGDDTQAGTGEDSVEGGTVDGFPAETGEQDVGVRDA